MEGNELRRQLEERLGEAVVKTCYVDADGDLAFSVFGQGAHFATVYLGRDGDWHLVPTRGGMVSGNQRVVLKGICARYIIGRAGREGT